jgi:mannose-6-phosphate isomerase class I
MQHIKKHDVVKVHNSSAATVFEYHTQSQTVSGATSEISGRYPEAGFAVNDRSHELVYVISGSGKLISPEETVTFSTGDVLLIENKELFAWEGNFTIFMATTPTFDPNQHRIIAEIS